MTQICRADGCSPDFLEHIAEHQNFLHDYFASHKLALDWTLESLTHLGDALNKLKNKQLPLPSMLIFGVVAYCGEVIRASAGGSWQLYMHPADMHSGPRYFPQVVTAAGQAIDFAGVVESDLWEAEECRFPIRIRMELSPLLFQVQKCTSHPLGDNLFPPLSAIS